MPRGPTPPLPLPARGEGLKESLTDEGDPSPCPLPMNGEGELHPGGQRRGGDYC